MDTFVAIDFETANSKRVSACALGYVLVEKGLVKEEGEILINPIGGHAEFQSRIHGLTDKDTSGKPNFGSLYPSIAHLFEFPVVGYSSFDKSVLNALSNEFGLEINFDYVDCCAVARREVPESKNHKLKTMAKYFGIPPFKHHNALEDARACADIFLRLDGSVLKDAKDSRAELQALTVSILKDGLVDYKEASQLLYWLEENAGASEELMALSSLIESSLVDESLTASESEAIRDILQRRLIDRASAGNDELTSSGKSDSDDETSDLGCIGFWGLQILFVLVLVAMFQPGWVEFLGSKRYVVIAVAFLVWAKISFDIRIKIN